MIFIPAEKANKKQCKEAINYFLKRNRTEAVIKYTERLYKIIDFETKFLSKANGS